MFESPVVRFTAELGSLAIFDPEVLASRVRQRPDWWRQGPLEELEEIREGRIVIAPIGVEGPSSLRVTCEDFLQDNESPYAKRIFTGFRLEVVDERLFLGPAERLPGDGRGERLVSLPDGGCCIEAENGVYDVAIQAIDWRLEERFFDDEGEPTGDAPPDFVVFLTPVEAGDDRPELGTIPKLNDLRDRPEFVMPKIRHPNRGVAKSAPERGESRRSGGSRTRSAAPVIGGAADLPGEEELSQFLRQAMADFGDCEDGDFAQGWVILQPLDRARAAHSWTTPELLKKITRVREHLRVLEQKVNGSPVLETEKLGLQAGVTHLYQSLDDLGRFVRNGHGAL